MNIFELTAIVTPLGGAISAGRAAFGFGLWRCAIFSLGGLLFGLAIYFIAIGLSACCMKLFRFDRRQEGVLASLLGLLTLIFVMIAPVVAIFATAILAPKLL